MNPIFLSHTLDALTLNCVFAVAFACPQAPCLLLLLLVVALPGALTHVSLDDVSTIHDGLSAGKDFIDSLAEATSSKEFTASLEKMSTMLGPWVDGIGVFSAVLGMFLPEDDAVLNAIKEGFDEVCILSFLK